ncbi:hypothetical protein [Actinomadura rupiterrae]|uniref:hypothetical protein n=1 Tax=Actinomadura rupiterrae TaxID=559627 RepID=UPI0020A50A7A|nr:hypothetical protein [Actinomadura rupiterrae]MCP2335288.1 hypothetical protein [Actinomadura rupiterrae]
MDDPMLRMLAADGPDPAHAADLMLYGRFVGEWEIENRHPGPDGEWRTVLGRWCFGWVLGGRAIQDVLYCPGINRYPGTTLRSYYVSSPGTWRITWNDPFSGSFVSQVGCADGPDIVQEGRAPDGRRTRWTFTEITDTSFLWRGLVETPDPRSTNDAEGEAFELVQEMRATRR